MIAAHREREILSLLKTRGSLRVSELTSQFGVTEETVRRDLRRLSQEGKLRRAHGGAVLAERKPGAQGAASEGGGGDIELPHNERQHVQADAKRAIAEEALKLIEPGTVIALDASTTACELARQLPDKPLTVVTNSLTACLLLAPKKRIETVCTGGVLDEDSAAFFGFAAMRCVRSLNIHRLFFSCRGIDLQRGLSEVTESHASMKLCFLEAANESILLADTSKFGFASTVFFAPATRPTQIITQYDTDDASRDAVTYLRGHNVRVTKAGHVALSEARA